MPKERGNIFINFFGEEIFHPTLVGSQAGVVSLRSDGIIPNMSKREGIAKRANDLVDFAMIRVMLM